MGVRTRTAAPATQLPPGYPPSIGFSRFGEKLAEYTDGRLTVKLQSPYAAPEMELLMRVRSGEIDFASVTTYVASALLPLAQIFDLPFLFANAQDAHAVLDGGLGRRVLNSFEAYGLTGMGYFENGIRHFTNNVREVSRPEDLQGLAIRIQDSVVYLALMHALRQRPASFRSTASTTRSRTAKSTARKTRCPTCWGRACSRCRNI